MSLYDTGPCGYDHIHDISFDFLIKFGGYIVVASRTPSFCSEWLHWPSELLNAPGERDRILGFDWSIFDFEKFDWSKINSVHLNPSDSDSDTSIPGRNS